MPTLLRRAVCCAWQCLICGNWTDASSCPNCTAAVPSGRALSRP